MTSSPQPQESSPQQSPATVPQVALMEQLYDTLGRPAFKTVAALKGAGAFFPGTVGFETGFVTPRNPAQETAGDFWDNGGVMLGEVDGWLDPRVYSTNNNQQYAYNGSYFESDPTSRLDKTSMPGTAFNASSSHTLQYRYGQFRHLPGGANPGSPAVFNSRVTLNTVMNNQALAQSMNSYATSTRRVPLGDQTKQPLYQINISELTGGAGISLSLAQQGTASQPYQYNYIMSRTQYLVAPITGLNGVKINYVYQPNAYDNSGNINPM